MREKVSAALYIRLSKEDERDGPSQSVTNQRAMLERYASDNQITVYDIYTDDGWSGCTFDRPDFQRLLCDIECGKVNMVITKDLSRLGRDYILTGHYLERYFPEHSVRYVSLLDGIDTETNASANDITPFRAIMNDMYAKDISRKITSVKRDKQRRGEFIGGKPVYGYRMHPTEKNRIIIDEIAAENVRSIFSMARDGTSCRRIAAILNEKGILSPSEYANCKHIGSWSGERISEMLQNETYLGNMVQGRRTKVSYKSKKSLRQKKEDWIVVEHTHEAIIDRSTFDAVARILDSRKRTRSRTYDFTLKGLICCHECGEPLGIVNRRTSAGKDVLYFICRTYQKGKSNRICTAHCVKVNCITDIVISEISKLFSEYLISDKLLLSAQKFIQEIQHPTPQSNRTDLLQDHKRINAQIDRLYLDRLNGSLDEIDFERIYQNLLQQRNNLEHRYKVEPTEIDYEAQAQELTQQFLATIGENRELLSQLIERIELTSENLLIIRYIFAQRSSEQ